MKNTLLKTLPYILLIILYISIGEYFMYRIRENIPLTTIVKKQSDAKHEYYYNKFLFGNVLSTYKYLSWEYRKPSIIVLGQSIVFNFRDFFFHPYEDQFYNTGLMVRTLDDLDYVRQLIVDHKLQKPEFLVIGIDVGMIRKDNQLDKREWVKNLEEDPVYNYKEHLRAIQEMYLKADSRKVPSTDLGMGKRGMEGNGYRRDGSFAFKWELDLFLKDSTHVEGPSKDELIGKTNFYKLPIDVDQTKWNKIFTVLNEYRKLGIDMVLYFPPLSDEFYKLAMEDEHFIHFWKEYMTLQSELDKQGYDVIPFTTPSQMGLNDYYMNNSNHPGDVLVATQFYNYCKSDTRKNKFVEKLDTNHLHKLLIDAKNPLSFMLDTLVYKKTANDFKQ